MVWRQFIEESTQAKNVLCHAWGFLGRPFNGVGFRVLQGLKKMPRIELMTDENHAEDCGFHCPCDRRFRQFDS